MKIPAKYIEKFFRMPNGQLAIVLAGKPGRPRVKGRIVNANRVPDLDTIADREVRDPTVAVSVWGPRMWAGVQPWFHGLIENEWWIPTEKEVA